MGQKLLAIVAEGKTGRVYLPPTSDMESIALSAKPTWKPDVEFYQQALGFRVGNYGMTKWSDLFTPRQLVALSTLSDLVSAAREKIHQDAIAAGMSDDGSGIASGETGASSYTDAITVYLAFAIDKAADYWSTICSWHSSKELIRNTFGRQAIPMVWDYAETNVFSESAGNVSSGIEWAQKALGAFPLSGVGHATQAAAQNQDISKNRVISTDPPYYDNVGYADLSDFFYVWLRRSMKPVFPELFATV
jgi:putative DNA methylase